jgi:hypothetical protein
MRKVVLLSLALLLCGAAEGFAQDVRYNFDKDTDFSKFKTYKWVTIKDSDHLNELTEKQITAALDAELAKKGLTKTDADNADLYIGYQTAVGSEKQFNSYSSGWGTGPGWGRGWYGGYGSTVQGILRHAKIQTTLDLYTQEDSDETRAAQGEYLMALGISTNTVQ